MPLRKSDARALYCMTYRDAEDTVKEAAKSQMVVVVAQAFNPCRQVELCEFEARLIYRVSSSTGSKATERNPVTRN